MANEVVGKVLGADPKSFNSVTKVSDVYKQLDLDGNYQATVNGDPAELAQELDDFDQVMFSPAIKGGL